MKVENYEVSNMTDKSGKIEPDIASYCWNDQITAIPYENISVNIQGVPASRRKYLRIVKVAGGLAAACITLYGLFAMRQYGDERYREDLLRKPYMVGIEDRWGYLKVLADENRDSVIDKKEREKLHSRMGLPHEGMEIALIEADSGPSPYHLDLSAFEDEIERAIRTYEEERLAIFSNR